MRKTIARATGNSSINEMKSELASLQKALVERDSQINALNESSLTLQVQLEICQGKSARLSTDNLALKTRIKGLEQEHQTRNTELAMLSKLVLQSDEVAQHSTKKLEKTNIELMIAKKNLEKPRSH
ncbi:hypothetical protein ACSZOC_09340 [Aeromonas hydrophila]